MPNNIARTATISFAQKEECFKSSDDDDDHIEERPQKQFKVDYMTRIRSNLNNNLVFGVKKVDKTQLSKDHILAERKRREKLNRRFIALSALLPGLKKSDKASVLEEAIRYVKELHEYVKHLEHVRSTRSENTVVVKKFKVISPSSPPELGYNSGDWSEAGDKTGPEIEVRFTGKNVLIRIHWQERSALASNFLREIESLQLTILNSCVMAFGKTAIDITLVAQMDEGFCMTANDVVKHLQWSMNSRT